MCQILSSVFGVLASFNWGEFIRTLAPVATAFIAYLALKNWQRQDKAKREADFLDSLIEAAHAYIAEMSRPITLLQMAKIAMESHGPSWEKGGEADVAVKGAIAYIENRGERDAKRLLTALEELQPTVIKLRSLAAKGQVFNFADYAKCRKPIAMLTWHFDRLEAFATLIGSPTWNWKNSEVLEHLKRVIAIDSEEMRSSVQESNAALLEFGAETYKSIYG